MPRYTVFLRKCILAGVAGLPALIPGCGEPLVCAPVPSTCAPVVSAATVAYEGTVVAEKLVRIDSSAPETKVLRAKAIAASVAAEREDAVVRREPAAPVVVVAEVPVVQPVAPVVVIDASPSLVQARPATPAPAGGAARLDQYERPENFSLVYPGLTPNELAHYGVGNHYEVAEPDFAEVAPLENTAGE